MQDLLKNKVAWLVAAVVVVGGGILLATSGGEKKLTINKDLQQKCMTDVNDETFCKFAGAFGATQYYKVSATTTGPEGTASVELSGDSRDNSQMVVKQNGQEQANLVVYSGVTYSKDYSDNQWFKFASDDANKPEVTDLKKEFAKGDFKNEQGQKIDYVKTGTEKCGNLTCFKYQVKDPAKPAEESFLWFDNSDYLLRRITVKDGQISTDMSVTYQSVSITEPSPTKEAPSL